METILFSLIAAVCYGTADFCGGLAARRAPLIKVVLISKLSAVGILVLYAYAFTPPTMAAGDVAAAALGAIATLSTAVLLYYGLSIGQMSVVAPTAAAWAIALPALLGGAVFGEPLDAVSGLAVAAAFGAVYIFTRSAGSPSNGTAVQRQIPRLFGIRVDLLAATGAGVSIALFYIAMKSTSSEAGLWPLATARLGAFGVLVIFGLARTAHYVRLPKLGRAAASIGAGAGILDASANTFYVLAAHAGELAVAATISSLYPVTTVALAAVFVGERLRGPHYLGLAFLLSSILLFGIDS